MASTPACYPELQSGPDLYPCPPASNPRLDCGPNHPGVPVDQQMDEDSHATAQREVADLLVEQVRLASKR